ncbi:MAG: 2-amino-4-hydroxy-6-hydroxymethyldihydropteridine diphosphokinase [Pseudomonadales bacterium]|nr:2-amino-4-hydroxy-6-hydroxymethyldihydropteridine diphosphokinase [Pseudomonadales bacterium]
MDHRLQTTFIALGSSIGDGAAQLRQAVKLLETIASGPIACSSLWQTEPFEMQASDWFSNAVVSFNTSLSAAELLGSLKDIERQSGRPTNHGVNTPRTLDLDIIGLGDEVICSEDLTIPHPKASQRLFVLLPLAEIAPDFRFPKSNESLATLIAQAPALEVIKTTLLEV